MAPKSAKGKGVAKSSGTVEPPESALSGDRTKSAFFLPSSIGVHDVTEKFREGRAEPAVEEQRKEGVSIRSQF